MAKFTIDLPATHVVTSRGKHVTIDLASIPEDVVTKLVLHGLTQKVADSAASATGDARTALGDKATDEAVKVKAAELGASAMQDVVDNLVKGIWGAVRTGGGITPLQAALRGVARTLFIASFNDAKRAKWKALDAEARNTKLDEVIAAQSAEVLAAWTAQAEENIKAEKARKAATAKLTGKLTGEIDL